MRQVILSILLMFLATNLAAEGLPGVLTSEFSISPWYSSHFGHTKFELEFEGGGSELVFPLDTKQVGLEFGYRTMDGGRPLWSLTIRVAHSLGDPTSKMTDRDWLTTDMGTQEFSSTESTAEGSMASIAGEFSHALIRGEKVELAAVVGAEYQVIQQDLVDLEGWQWYLPDLPDNITVIVFQDDELAGTYVVRYFRPELGLMPRFYLGPITVEAKAVVSPLAHVRDIDDHVRRHFQIRTDGKGFGWGGSLALEWQQETQSTRRFFGKLSGDVSRVSIDASGARIFYADEIIDLGPDPVDPSDDEIVTAGSRFLEEHKISSTQYSVRLQFGLRL